MFTVLPRFTQSLVALKTLRLDLTYMTNKSLVPNFLLDCSRLEALDLTSYVFVPSRFERHVFTHLGKTLRSLKLHQHENSTGKRRRTVLDKTSLDLIAETCPRLRSLGLDLDCEPTVIFYHRDETRDWVSRKIHLLL